MEYYCENCGKVISGTVFGTGDDATGYCGCCCENVNCYCIDDEETLPPMERDSFDPNELGL